MPPARKHVIVALPHPRRLSSSFGILQLKRERLQRATSEQKYESMQNVSRIYTQTIHAKGRTWKVFS